jgi:hypothetical protein
MYIELSVLSKQQCGFVPGRSCSDPIFCARCVLQQTKEFNSAIACCFVDFEKAFDSPHRPAIWRILALYGIPPRVMSMIKAQHLDSKCTVKTPDGPTDAFKISTGVRQGCVLAPFIFVILMDYLLRKSIRDSCRVPMPVSYGNNVESVGALCDLEYADDLALFAKTVDGIQENLNALADNL